MKQQTTMVWLAGALVAFSVGCSERDADVGRSASDAGGGAGIDGGVEARDAGAASRIDAGLDASTPRDGALPAPDAPVAPSDAGPRGCELPLTRVPTELTPRCSDATRTAMGACAEDDALCVRMAISRDTVPSVILVGGTRMGCLLCLALQQKYCVANNGCLAQTQRLDCCTDEHCPRDGACTTSTCMTEYTAWQDCATTIAAPCLRNPTGGEFAICFPPE